MALLNLMQGARVAHSFHMTKGSWFMRSQETYFGYYFQSEARREINTSITLKCVHIQFFHYNASFSQWIKSISHESDIAFHMHVSQLPCELGSKHRVPFCRRHFQMHFSGIKITIFRLEFPQILFIRLQLTTSHHLAGNVWDRTDDKPLSEPMMA